MFENQFKARRNRAVLLKTRGTDNPTFVSDRQPPLITNPKLQNLLNPIDLRDASGEDLTPMNAHKNPHAIADVIQRAIAQAKRSPTGGVTDITPVAPVQTPVPSYGTDSYGDAIIFPVIVLAAGDVLVLPRPKNTRIELLIVNTLAASPIYYQFDRVADIATGIPIPVGNNRLWDARVPQNDLHIFFPVAGAILIEFMNADVNRA